ncbi:PTS sugar transporter subunit IIA [Pontibacter sp. JAM-7]|uniref:PTS sugar transporter subunit IIA n=1 Tax=Pontibacter sp. JAM-7 TaxID=3366581 RepID=UPI003AF8ADDF
MPLSELLTPSSIHCDLESGSKKRIIETASELLADAHPELDATALFNGLHGRERLGSTGIGSGVGIPHCRLAECSAAVGLVVRLKEAIDFDAIDHKPVDLLFFLVVPEDGADVHLKTLASIAELMANPDVLEALRTASGPEKIYQIIQQRSG